MSPGNHVLDGGQHRNGAIFRGKGHPIVKYRDTFTGSDTISFT